MSKQEIINISAWKSCIISHSMTPLLIVSSLLPRPLSLCLFLLSTFPFFSLYDDFQTNQTILFCISKMFIIYCNSLSSSCLKLKFHSSARGYCWWLLEALCSFKLCIHFCYASSLYLWLLVNFKTWLEFQMEYSIKLFAVTQQVKLSTISLFAALFSLLPVLLSSYLATSDRIPIFNRLHKFIRQIASFTRTHCSVSS